MSLKLSHHAEGARSAPLEHRLVTARLEIPAHTLARVGIAILLTLAALTLVRSLSEVIVMVVVALVIAVVAFPMGAPFPAALARLRPESVPWALAWNGCASVAAAAGAPLLASTVSIPFAAAAAALFYVLISRR